jgi:5-methylcytosine-specific restriction endonuclease McrA
MSKVSKACDISPSVRQEVMDRDGGRCIICGSMQGIQIAHFISRARLGMGIAKNLACLCLRCHGEYDNGKLHSEIKNAFKGHLQANYDHWDETELTYKKWR